MTGLTDRDFETLADLEWTNRKSKFPVEWARPLDIGGHNRSHHSATLAKLVKKGFVQSKQRGWPDPKPGEPEPNWSKGSRGSKVYRITDAGVEALLAHVSDP